MVESNQKRAPNKPACSSRAATETVRLRHGEPLRLNPRQGVGLVAEGEKLLRWPRQLAGVIPILLCEIEILRDISLVRVHGFQYLISTVTNKAEAWFRRMFLSGDHGTTALSKRARTSRSIVSRPRRSKILTAESSRSLQKP